MPPSLRRSYICTYRYKFDNHFIPLHLFLCGTFAHVVFPQKLVFFYFTLQYLPCIYSLPCVFLEFCRVSFLCRVPNGAKHGKWCLCRVPRFLEHGKGKFSCSVRRRASAHCHGNACNIATNCIWIMLFERWDSRSLQAEHEPILQLDH
jgi:hypothetical protein